MKEVIKIKVETYKDREKISLGLINSGYKVWVETEDVSDEYIEEFIETNHYICFEVERDI